MAAARGRVTVMETDGVVVGESEDGGVASDCFFDLFRFRSGDVTFSRALEAVLWAVVFGTTPSPGDGGEGFLRGSVRLVILLVMALAIEGFGGFLAGIG